MGIVSWGRVWQRLAGRQRPGLADVESRDRRGWKDGRRSAGDFGTRAVVHSRGVIPDSLVVAEW